jgi:predicted aspartyl protease
MKNWFPGTAEGIGRRGFLRAAGVTAGATAVLASLAAGEAVAASTSSTDPDQLFQAGWFAQADAGYALLLEQEPGDAYAWAQRGYIALLANRFGDTERFLGRAIELAPADQVSMGRLADCFVRQDDFTRAVELFLAAGDRIGAAQYSAVTGTPYEIRGASSALLPFQAIDPLPMIEASVNGTRATFVLDTGATFGFTAAMARQAGVQAVSTVMVNHGNGPVRAYIGVVDSLRLGGIGIRDVPVMWDDTSFADAPGNAVGVIGTTIFYHFLTTMDYAAGALLLRPRTAAFRDHDPSAVTAPLWLAPDHFMFSSGRIGRSGPGLVLLDTGGVGLGVVLTSAQAAQAGVVPDYSEPGTYFGVTAYPCTADSIEVGRVARRDVPGAVGPFAPSEFGFSDLGTLSHEFFKPLSVTFDFVGMNVHFARR